MRKLSTAPSITRKVIEVWADWVALKSPFMLGTLAVDSGKRSETYSFEYDSHWLKNGHGFSLDPRLQLFPGPQYPPESHENFGVFLDSSPDRWGCLLMDRREAQSSREEGRATRKLRASDYLLGVHDEQRLGALRFRLQAGGPFLDNSTDAACPPWTSLRELEAAALAIERKGSELEPDYRRWIRMLIAPGGSLGGARPKAGVTDIQAALWIAKFPSRGDDVDKGAWEYVTHHLAQKAGVHVSEAEIRKYNTEHHTFLTKRFDRTSQGRIHFSSAMTALNRQDGDDYTTGASYLELAEFLMKNGAQAERDLEQLWRRIVFSMAVSNVDDHLRNHGFLLSEQGWVLSPAYDINPDPDGDGLKLNVSESDNQQDFGLALEVSQYFRLKLKRSQEILSEVILAVKEWPKVAASLQLSRRECELMEDAFRLAAAK